MRLTRGLESLLALLHCFCHFIFVRSSPLQITPLQVIDINNTAPDSILLSNVSVTAPSPPRSILLNIDHDFNKKLLALGMYLTAINAVVTIGRNGWDDKPIGPQGYRIFAKGPGVWAKGYDVEIDVKNSQKPEDPLQLKTSYIITGLWEMMVQVSKGNLYYETILTLKQHYREIGTVTIKELTLGGTANGTKAAVDLFSTSALPGNAGLALTQAVPVNLTAVPPYPTGWVALSSDNRFKMMYTYTGTQIKSKDVFMALLGLLADAAQHPADTPLQGMQQLSPSKRCQINLRPLPTPYRVTYAYALKALGALVYLIMLPLEKFGEMTFELEFQDHKLAQGNVQALDPAPGVAAEEK